MNWIIYPLACVGLVVVVVAGVISASWAREKLRCKTIRKRYFSCVRGDFGYMMGHYGPFKTTLEAIETIREKHPNRFGYDAYWLEESHKGKSRMMDLCEHELVSPLDKGWRK